MILTDQFHELLETEMDRKEFLAYAGATLLAVIGVSGLFRVLTQPVLSKHTTQHHQADGYGSGVYGGHQ